MRVRLQQHSAEGVRVFEAAIQSIDSILDCYVMTGSDDYLLRVVVESLKDYEQFVRARLHRIAGIASIDTSFAYGVVKRSAVFPKIRNN